MRYINPYKLYKGSFIPEWLEIDPEISHGAKIVYARLCRFAGKDGIAYPKIETIALSVGIGVRQAKRYTSELKDKGLIDIDQRGLGKSNVYRFLDPGDRFDTSEVTYMTPREDRFDTSEVTDMTLPYIEDNHYKIITEDNHSKEANTKKIMELTNKILIHLNNRAGENFEPKWANKQYIHERLIEGADPEMMKMVIELKAIQSQKIHKGKPVFDPVYLRPQTLFSKNNYEKYIREVQRAANGEGIIPFKKRKSAGIERAINGIDEALQRRFESSAAS